MKTKILTLTGLVLISACEVTVKPEVETVPTTKMSDPVPEVEVIVEPDPLPTSDPFEAFLYPSVNLTPTIEPELRNLQDDLAAFRMSILNLPTYTGNTVGESYRYPVYLESDYGVEYAYIQQNRTTGLMRLCTRYTAITCYAEIRNIRWIDQNRAAMDVCYVYNNVDWNTCVTKYSDD
jgi:hypothetical protein